MLVLATGDYRGGGRGRRAYQGRAFRVWAALKWGRLLLYVVWRRCWGNGTGDSDGTAMLAWYDVLIYSSVRSLLARLVDSRVK